MLQNQINKKRFCIAIKVIDETILGNRWLSHRMKTLRPAPNYYTLLAYFIDGYLKAKIQSLKTLCSKDTEDQRRPKSDESIFDHNLKTRIFPVFVEC